MPSPSVKPEQLLLDQCSSVWRGRSSSSFAHDVASHHVAVSLPRAFSFGDRIHFWYLRVKILIAPACASASPSEKAHFTPLSSPPPHQPGTGRHVCSVTPRPPIRAQNRTLGGTGGVFVTILITCIAQQQTSGGSWRVAKIQVRVSASHSRW